jgi:cytochrome c553
LKRLRTGERVIFGVVTLIMLVAIVNYAILAWLGHRSEKPLFPVRTHYEFAGEGFHGSELFRKSNCTACHRAIGNGSNMSLNLDGIGSRHDVDYIIAFLRDPEATYRSRTVDHGPAPKEAAYVSQLPESDRHAIAVFLSQLRTDQGGASAQQPPPGKSGFIDAMLDMWAPDGWRIMFSDVRSGDSGKNPAALPADREPPKPDATQAPPASSENQEQGNGNGK